MNNSRIRAIAEKLQAEWDDIPDGFFSKLRDGIMDQDRYEHVLRLLKEARDVSLAYPEDCLDKLFVKVLWFMPIFMAWQIQRVEKNGYPVDVYTGDWCATIENIVSEILGEP